MRRSNYTLSVPLALATTGKGLPLQVRAPGGAALLEAAKGLDWQQVREVTLPSLDDFEAVSALHSRTRWSVLWQDFSLGRLLDRLPLLRRRRVTVLVAPKDAALYDKLVVGESLALHMAVDLDDPDAVDLAVWNQLVSHVLLTGGWRPVRLEPLTSLVATAAGRRSLTLWDYAHENVHTNLWADAQGRVSLSARLAQSHPYTTLDALDHGSLGQDRFEQSASYLRLADYAEGLFRDRAPCATCRSFPLCGGWLRYVDPAYDCELWQLVLSSVMDAVGDTGRARALRPPPARPLRR